jgi:hypothetical protein
LLLLLLVSSWSLMLLLRRRRLGSVQPAKSDRSRAQLRSVRS